ncbi:MAG: hypothetical protein ABH885_08485 [Candidatus Omnitrophota bacterium]
MGTYKTRIHVVARGEDVIEVQEKAGRLFDVSRMIANMTVSCGPTWSCVCYGAPGAADKVYETVISVINEGSDELEAGELAGALVDITKMESGMVVSCEATREIISQDSPLSGRIRRFAVSD